MPLSNDHKVIRAAETGDAKAIEALAAAGVNLNEIYAINGQTLAHIAIEKGHINVLRVLIENSTDAKKKNISPDIDAGCNSRNG